MALLVLILTGCGTESPATRPVLAETIKLVRGSYDIPYYLEPARDVELILHEIKPIDLESEYSKFRTSGLNRVSSTEQPLRISAYRYVPRAEDIQDVSLDEEQVQANPAVQVCVGGPGCVNFYVGGEVIVLEFEGEVEAAAFAKDFLALELSKHRQKDKRLPDRYGATFVEPWLAFRVLGPYFYIVSSWMPETMEAILTARNLNFQRMMRIDL